MDKLKVLDLFSGIGGFSLGLERAGMETVAFCEIDPHARKVLKKHWPEIYIHQDIRDIGITEVPVNIIEDSVNDMLRNINVICGGFPCQGASTANTNGKGIDDERTGLWSEYFRLIKEIKPRYVIAENVPNLRNRGLAKVIKDLSSVGYVGRFDVISARAFGAAHQRERLFIVATHSDNNGFIREAYAESTQNSKKFWESNRRTKRPFMQGAKWPAEPRLDRVVHGVSDWSREDRNARKERIKQLGNSVVPAIPEWIGRQIIEWENKQLTQLGNNND